MGKENYLTVPGKYDQIRVLCQFLADGAREAGMDKDGIFHVELCCDEAATNIIEHAYGAEDVGLITAAYEVSGEQFKITLHDDGRPFIPDDVPEPKQPESEITGKGEALNGIINSLQIGGFGIYFMRKLMDEVQYSFNGDSGNTLVLIKNLRSEDDE